MGKIKAKIRYGIFSAVLLVCGSLWMASSQPDFTMGKNIQILFNMFREIYVMYVDDVDSDQLLADAAEGMVKSLDPYTEIILEKDMESFEIMTTGKYGGIGSMIRKTDDYVMIAQPYKGFPADKAGLVIGDKIISVNGKSIKGVPSEEVSAMLKGDPGSRVNIMVEKLLTGDREGMTLQRERIVIPGVPYYTLLDGTVGYIIHEDFTENCAEDILRAFNDLKKQGMTSLILDLRSNGGGILQEAVKIMSFFVPKGTEVVSMRGRLQQNDRVFRTETEPIDTEIPIIVMINGNTASAAEIVAGAMQDLDRAVIVGQRSFGKGLVQSPRPVGYNSYLKITTAKYYIPSGRCIQAIDYAHRDEEGRVSSIPDSLITEYSTSGGRKVYDGAGIMPDSVFTQPPYVSTFAVVLHLKGYLDDYANHYYYHHREPVDVDNFTLSDDDYADFVRFMADKDTDYDSQTKTALDALKQRALREGYLSTIEDELSSVEVKIKQDKEKDLYLFRDDISKLIEDQIILHYHYAEGIARHRTNFDDEIKRAVKFIQDTSYYHYVLTSKDTNRK